MGFIQQAMQNQQQGGQQGSMLGQGGMTGPEQGAQGRSGIMGLIESMRNMTPPSQNLPSQAMGQGSPQGGGFGGGIQDLIQQMRERLGSQGLGGQISMAPGTMQRPDGTPQLTPGQRPGQVNAPQMPNLGGGWEGAPNWPIHIANQGGGSTPWQPGVGFPGGSPIPGGFPGGGQMPQMPTQKPPGSAPPQVHPVMPTNPVVRPQQPRSAPTGGGMATGDPRPPSPTGASTPQVNPRMPTSGVQSKYGSLSGVRRPGIAR